MKRFDFDVAIIGGGSGGYAAARTAAGAGLKTVVIEGGEEVGGLCILRGCMPTKAMLYAAEVKHLAEHAATWGVRAEKISFDFAKVMARKNLMIKDFAGFRVQQLNAGKFKFIRANAKFLDAHTVEVTTPHPGPLPVGRGEGEGSAGEKITCDKLLLATGGCRTPALGQLAVALGHTLAPPVPSLFTFHVEIPWLRELAGVSLETVEASVPGTKLRERGALLLTHWGLSGPAILRLSAWGARELHEKNYSFTLQINWLPHLNVEKLAVAFKTCRQAQPAKFIVNTPLAKVPSRLWEQLVIASGIARDTRWAALSGAGQHQLIQQLLRSEFPVTGKSLNKDEFVTCGGVRLNEINFKTMESRICPGLFFAGEVLDIDGITGGFNFQAAWTTGWLAGRALAGS